MSEIAQIKAVGEEQASEPLPHNIEAEQQLLGAILTNNDIYDRVAGVINESHFYDPVHARIYEIAASRIAKNALASPVTLKAFLEDDPGLELEEIRLAGQHLPVAQARGPHAVELRHESGGAGLEERDVADEERAVRIDEGRLVADGDGAVVVQRQRGLAESIAGEGEKADHDS